MTQSDAFRPVADARPWPAMVWPVSPGTALTGRHVRLTPLDLEAGPRPSSPCWTTTVSGRTLPERPADADSLARTLLDRGARPGWQQWLARLL